MTLGMFYGIGVGPGDPELVTVKGARILAQCPNVFVPKAGNALQSVAFAIARDYLAPGARVWELTFPMTTDRVELASAWDASAREVAIPLGAGQDACFLTLGDPLLYSTYIYLLRALRARIPDLQVVTVPGITAMCAAASLAEFPIGQFKESVTIVPAADDLRAVRQALAAGGTLVLMKVGKRLEALVDLLENEGFINRSVFVSRAGMAGQRIETDLRKLRGEDTVTGYLSVILVRTGREEKR
ncbi:MAG: precorrin-2 C(20)-methyltransferase [Deltaproteobacteria bacterium]|nr:precorrin-2 C(20)-methyltransferase [Deltaproteobacteria bacterium]